jgi:acyl-CoA hydrolase
MPMTEENGKYVSDSASQMQQIVLPNDTNILGNLLGGKVMEWIDMVGAMVAYRHSRRPIVTASMERLDFHHPIKLGNIVILKAELTYVGRTSMEVSVSVFSENPRTGENLRTSSATLTYVALDDQEKPTPVIPLLLRTAEEKRRFEEAEQRRIQRDSEKKI